MLLNSFFQMPSYARSYVCIIYEKPKENSHGNITWFEMAKQNVQTKEVHFAFSSGESFPLLLRFPSLKNQICFNLDDGFHCVKEHMSRINT